MSSKANSFPFYNNLKFFLDDVSFFFFTINPRLKILFFVNDSQIGASKISFCICFSGREEIILTIFSSSLVGLLDKDAFNCR